MMTAPETKAETIAVVGFGRAGQALVRYLHGTGIRVLVSDVRDYSDLSTEARHLLECCAADFEGGGHSSGFLGQADIVVVSPGVDSHQSVLEKIRQSGTPVLGELALAAGKFASPVIAVTGTNGKTTVTELIGALFAAAGKNAFVGGNIGTPIGDYLISEDEFEVVVLEVSSFQLDMCGDFIPDIGILLNISPDHLDRHGTLENYASAKMKMFQGGDQTFGVINGDDELCCRFGNNVDNMVWARFGHDRSFVGAIDGSRIVLQNGQTYDLTGSNLDNLSGRLNSSAALLGVTPFNLDPQCLKHALREFEPGEHRMQTVGSTGGVTFINDSKATNTGAVNNAIMQIGGAIILIAGGRDKGDDYTLLRGSVATHVKRLILIGEAAGHIGGMLGDLAPVDYPATLEEAVEQAAAAGEPGDTVLLSPACASFDMFDNYQHRGQCFTEAVRKLGNVLIPKTVTEPTAETTQ